MREQALSRWFRTFFESLSDAFVVFDSTGSVVAANPAVEELLGHPYRALRGSSIRLILPSLDAEARSDALGDTPARCLELEARRRDGAIVPLAVSLAPVESGGRRMTIARLGKRPVAEMEARPSMEEIVTRGGPSAEFQAILMHELRTPLQAVLGWTQLLRSGPHDAQAAQEILGAIERNVHWQAQVVEDLLEMSQILSGDLRLEIRPTRAAAVVESAVQQISSLAESKGIRLVRTFGAGRDEILADPERLARVIRRLLFDAIRYTSEGGEAGISLERAGSAIRITVNDDGAGDDPASSHASGWFRRSTGSSTTNFARFGVGLSIVQRVVEMHVGQVGAESGGPGHGSRFFVTLPLVAKE